jgi:hypothetical protein
MEIDLTQYNCTELEITGGIELSPELKKELLEVARETKQLEDGDSIFFHQDYIKGGTKHHFDITLEQLAEQEQKARIEIYYAVVEPGEIRKTRHTPEYLISRIIKGDLISFECSCSLDVQKEAMVGPLSSIPLKLSIGTGEIEVVYKGVYLTLRENGEDLYDLLLQVADAAEGGQVFRFEFTFTHEDRLFPELPGNVLAKALSYMNKFVRA